MEPHNNKKSTTSNKMQSQDTLLSEAQLYAVDLHYTTTDDELKNIFKDIDSINVEIRRHSIPINAVLRFSSIENAEKAFACFNNNKMENNKSYLKLLINDPNANIGEPAINAIILQVKQLPPSTNNLALYTLFRPFGPLFSCRIQLTPDNKFKGQALVQYFKQEDAENAMNNLHCKVVENKTINVSQYGNKNTPKIRTNSTNNITNHNNFNVPTAAGHTFSPQGSNNNNHNNNNIHNNNNNQAAPMSPGPEGPLVDLCNLFIKNLDASITSSDLFHHFRRFGRIISARVMRDQETGNSKGFGFVSYTSAEEADKAKSSMHGKSLGSKQIVVRFHEPKKLREQKLAANQFNGTPISPSESRAPSRRNSDHFNINTVNEFGQEDLNGLAPKARREVLMSELQKRFKYISVPPEEVNPIIDQLLNSKVPEVLQMLKDASLLNQKITEARSTILNDRKRRGNEEMNIPTTSIINNNNNNYNNLQMSQRDKFLKAITKIYPRNAAEILDLLMTMNTKERSMCLFNAEYLTTKIIEANAALEAVSNDSEISINPPASTPPMTLSHSVRSYNTEVPAAANNGIHTPEYKEIEKFMETLKDKPVHEQKQKLGDRLFPKVKSLGLKSAIASKVTINLLDTDDLHELAHSMNDKVKFEQKVKAAAEKVGTSSK